MATNSECFENDTFLPLVQIDMPKTPTPDGTKIAFQSDSDGNSEIYVMNADGTGQINLTNSEADDSGPAWSPFLPQSGIVGGSP